MFRTEINRRSALAMGALPMLMALPGRAETVEPPEMAPMPGVRRFGLGGFAVTTLLGGANTSDNPIATFGLEVDPQEFQQLSHDNFIPAEQTGGSFTLSLVQTPEAVVLFDTGMVPQVNEAALAAAGYAPGDITHVVLTHMHADHVSGLMQGDTPSFPNAQLIAPQAENDYWAANPSDAYRTHVAPLIGQARLIGDGEEIVAGITAEAAPGHTPGHTTYLIDSEEQKLLISGDSFNHYVYSVQRPDWHVRFDIDKQMGAATRRKVLARLAAERMPFVGYHMPFPALGFIAPNGQDPQGAESFRFVPATYQFS